MNIFISYAKQDFALANKVYNDLHRFGFDAWIDSENLLPGQNWKTEISRAIRNSKFFLALLSQNSVNKMGYVQKELNEAIEILDLIPPGQIYLIPAKLDDCQPNHHRLNDLHWVDLFPSYRKGMNKILRVLDSKTYFDDESADEMRTEEQLSYELPESTGVEVFNESGKRRNPMKTLLAEQIERDPTLATEANLADLLKSLIEVQEFEGRELGGYDYNLQSYYESLYSVTKNAAAFDAIRAIAKHNPVAFSHRNRMLLKEIEQREIRFQVATSTLSPGTSYSSDIENLRQAEQERALILEEVKALFGTHS